VKSSAVLAGITFRITLMRKTYTNTGIKLTVKDDEQIEYQEPNSVCDKWQSDGLTRKEREG
jgi:hypothetical protein